MSTRDERVVSLKFDNAQFERGASESMSTLDKLKEKLKFKDAEKDLGKLQKSVDSVTFDKIQKSLESLEKRFSVMGIAGMRIIENLTDKALAGLAKVEQATLGQIKNGGWSRAMNLANAQFQIEGLGYSWDKVLEAVDYGVKDTAYGLDAAASAAAQLAASGVDFEHAIYKAGNTSVTAMHKALRAISGVAAMTNSSYDDIANVFTRVAGQGKVMATDLNSIAARGLNAAATLAKYLNTTEAEIRDLVSAGEINFQIFSDAMDSAFGDHAKEANKTFNGALSNMKAALSRIGALFAQPVVNKTNEIFVALTGVINNAKKALSDLVIEEEGQEIKIERFQSHFEQAWESMTNAVVTFIDTISPDWFQHVADVFDRAAMRMKDFFDSFKTVIESIQEAVQEAQGIIDVSIEDAIAAFEIFFNGKYGNGKARVKALQQAGRDAKAVQALINDWYKSGFDPAKMTMKITDTSAADLAEWLAEVRKNGYKLTNTNKKLGQSIGEVGDEVEGANGYWQDTLVMYQNIGFTILTLRDIVSECFSTIGNVVYGAYLSFKRHFNGIEATFRLGSIVNSIHEITSTIQHFTDFTRLEEVNFRIEELQAMLERGASNAKDLYTEIDELRASVADVYWTQQIFDSLARSINNVWTVMRNLGRVAVTFGRSIIRAFLAVFTPDGVAFGIEEVTWTFAEFSEKLVLFAEKISPLVESGFYVIFSAVKTGINLVKNFTVKIFDFLGNLLGVDEMLIEIDEDGNEIIRNASEAPSVIDRISDSLIRVGDWVQTISDFFIELFDLLSENEGVAKLETAVGNLTGTLGELFFGSAEAVGEFGSLFENQNEKRSAAEQVADAIGWIADKLATVIDLVPKAIKAINDFFDDAKNGFAKLFSSGFDASNPSGNTDANNRLTALYGIPETIRESVSSEEAEKTAGTLETFFHRIGEALKNGFSNVHLEDMKNLAIIAGVLYSLWAMNSILTHIRSIPVSISRMFRGIGVMIEAYGVAWRTQLKIESYVVFIKALVEAIIAITGWMVILGSVDSDVLYKGVAVVGAVALFLTLLTKQIAKIKETRKNRNYNQQVGLLNNNLQGTATTLLGFGVALAGLGVALYAFFEVVKFISGIGDYTGAMVTTLVIIGGVLLAVVGFAALLSVILNRTKTLDYYNRADNGTTAVGNGNIAKLAMGNRASYGTTNPLISAIYSISVMLIALSAAVAVLAVSMAIMKATKIDWKQIGMISVILLSISGAIAIMFLGFSAVVKNLNRGQKSSQTLVLMAGMVATIIAFAYALKMLFSTLALLAGGGGLLTLVAGSSADAVIGGIVGALLGLAAVIVAIGGAIAWMAKAVSKLSAKQVWALPVILIGIAAVLGAMGAVLFALSGCDPNNVVTAALTIGGLILAIAAAARIMTGGKYAKNPKEIAAIALGVIAMAGAIAIIAYAVKSLTDVPANKLFPIAGAIGVVVLALTAFVAIVGSNEKRVKAISAIGSMLLSLGAGALLLGAGLLLINMSLPAFAEGLTKILEAVDKHWAAFLVVGGVIIGIMALLYKFLKPVLTVLMVLAEFIGDILKGVGKGIGSVVSSIGNILSSMWDKIAEFFKKHGRDIIAKLKEWGAKIRDWILGLPRKIKALLTILMLALGADLSSENGSSSLLGTVGKVFKKLLEYLKKGMPAFVGEILELILSAVEALAGGIRKRSNRFAAAFWIIVSTLVGLLGDILKQGLGFLGINVDWEDATDKFYKKARYNSAVAYYKDIDEAYAYGEASLEEHTRAHNELIQAQQELVEASGKAVEALAFGGGELQQGFGRITDNARNIDTNISIMREIVSKANELGSEAEIFKSLGERLGDENANYMWEALKQMGLGGLQDLNTEEGYKKLMEFAALREAVELEQNRMFDAENRLGLEKGTLYDAQSKEDWANNDYGAASWFLTVFAPYLKTDQKYIDIRNKMLEDMDSMLDFQAEVQAKAYNIVHGTKLDEDEFAKSLRETEKLYGEQTDFYKREQAKAKAMGWSDDDGMAASTLKSSLNYNMSQGYDIDSRYFYAKQMAQGFITEYQDILGGGIADAQSIVEQGFTSMASSKEIAKAAAASATSNATSYTDALNEAVRKECDTSNEQSTLSKITGSITGAISNATSSKKVYDSSKDLGTNIPLGLAKGIEDPEARAQLAESLKELGIDANQIFSQTEGIESPSKVFAKFGEYIVQGLANGISDNEGTALGSSENLAQRTIDAFGNPLDYVSKVMSGELTYDPSIRPIMDMSSIQSGANSVNGMFQNQNVAISGFSGRLAADIGQLQRDNQDVVDEIALLREDMAEMTEQITNLQVVMDNGALVGQLAGGMDQELGTRASRKGRGI